MLDNKKLWEAALARIELLVSKGNFNVWFKPTTIMKQEDGVITLCVPSPFVKEWLSDKFHKTILRILRELQENVRSIEYVISAKKQAQEGAVMTFTGPTRELPFADLYINPEDNLN